MNRKLLALLLIVVVAFAARIGYSVRKGIGQEPGNLSDDVFFDSRCAWNMVPGDGFRGPEPGYDQDELSAYLPGAPALYATVYVCFGRNYPTVRIVVAHVGAASVAMLFLLAKAVAFPRAGLVVAAAIAFIFYPLHHRRHPIEPFGIVPAGSTAIWIWDRSVSTRQSI